MKNFGANNFGNRCQVQIFYYSQIHKMHGQSIFIYNSATL